MWLNCIKILLIFLFFLFLNFFFLGNKLEKVSNKIADFLIELFFKRGLKYGVKFEKDGYPKMRLYGEYHYSPIIFCWLIHNKFSNYDKNRDIILKYADLILNRHFKNNIMNMDLNYPVKIYNIDSTWHSALIDARVIELMDYAYLLTKSEKYLNFINNILEHFKTTIENGGVLSVLDSNAYWYMEYAFEKTKPYVLNGMISSVLVLYKHYNITKNPKVLELAKKGSNAIAKNLTQYDRNGYSYYDLKGRICSPFYHTYQTNLLRELYEFDRRDVFIQISNKWKKYYEKTFILKKYIKNSSMRGYAVLLIDLFICSMFSIAYSIPIIYFF